MSFLEITRLYIDNTYPFIDINLDIDFVIANKTDLRKKLAIF